MPEQTKPSLFPRSRTLPARGGAFLVAALCALSASACDDEPESASGSGAAREVVPADRSGTPATGLGVERPAAPLTFESAEATHLPEGEPNLNRVVRDEAHGLYAIVSGFGPTIEGAMGAADTAVAPFAALGTRHRPTGDALAEAALRANEELVRNRTEGNDVHGATFASLIVTDGQLEVAHVGDVLVFRLRGGELERLVLGHTVVEDFIREQALEGAEAEELRQTAPHREVIVRALGVRMETAVERKREPVLAGDILVVCSAALHLALGLDSIESILTSTEGGADAKAHALVDAVEAHEGTDTPTALVISAR